MKLVALIAVAVFVLACSAVADGPAPLALGNSAVGGGKLNDYTPGVEGGVGLYNIGSLIRTWGKVTYIDPALKFFYINDGSGRDDASEHIGLRVQCDNTKLAPPNTIDITSLHVNDYVAITGISSTWHNDTTGKNYSNLLPRRQSDVQLIL